jgi:hypothetical protein
VATLTVGPGQEFATIEDAVQASSPGDNIDVQAGTYNDDFLTIEQSLTLQAVGGEVVMTEDHSPPNGKAMITEGQPGLDIAINGFDISGVIVPDGNGAAIRYEGGNLTLNQDYFHNNQEGLLAASDPNGNITINDSQFSDNGDGSGYTHNLYVNQIATLTVENSFFSDANVGHDIKSRAENTIIEDNRITDVNGDASYEIDVPNAGNTTITGNTIEKGPNAQNPNFIAYGEEGIGTDQYGNPYSTSLNVSDNTFVNDNGSPSVQALWNATGDGETFDSNAVWGLSASQLPASATDTTFLPSRPSLDTSPLDFACFLAGTHIATPTGALPVERVSIGDLVTTLVGKTEALTDGHLTAQPVKWVGRRRIDLTTHPQPEVVAPVRIQRGAFAEDVPHADLLLSPDHAIFVEGKLICARQLINGTTICQERGWPVVEYFHIELDGHAILLAEGLPAESYLDTGNRGFFGNSVDPLVLHPDLTGEADYPTREVGSCAPFVWDEASVRPVWQRLADRAAAVGQPQRATTTEPNPRIRGSDGERNHGRPIYADSNLVIFMLPRDVREVSLLSRAQAPTEARPWLEDRRRLGIRVKRIVLRGMNERREIPMDHPSLTEGWWGIERDGQMMTRWTDGAAVIPLPAMDGPVMLEVHLAGEMIYAVDTEVPDSERVAA